MGRTLNASSKLLLTVREHSVQGCGVLHKTVEATRIVRGMYLSRHTCPMRCRMGNRLRWLLLMTVVLCESLSAQGPSALWKQRNLRDNVRYEGVGFDRPVGSVGLELIGLVAHQVSGGFGKVERLAVDFAAPSDLRYTIIARELVVSEYYWMETKPQQAQKGRQTFTEWRTTVLRKHPTVTASNLGLIVHAAEASRQLVLPAILRNASVPAARTDTYRAMFLPETLLKNVTYTLYAGCSSPGAKLKGGILGRQYAQVPFEIVMDLSDLAAHRVALTLDFQRPDGPARYSVCIALPSRDTVAAVNWRP